MIAIRQSTYPSSKYYLKYFGIAFLIGAPSTWAKQLAKYLPTAGFIGVLVGTIGVLQSIQEPKAIGPAMAISLLTLTYCNIVSVTLKLALPNAHADEDMNSFTYLGFVLLFVIFITAVLLLSFL